MASILSDLVSHVQQQNNSYVSVVLTVIGLAFVVKQTVGVVSTFFKIFVLSGTSVRPPV